MKYYIVDKGHLSEYGHEDGVDSEEEVIQLLEAVGDEAVNLAVIKGSEITFTIHQKVTLDE